jgi:PBSX family phage terminase large subunit
MLSLKQIKSLNESNAKINIWQGAVRSGKTYISLLRFLKELTNGPKGEYAIITRTYDSFKRNILPQLTRFIQSDARHYQGKREMLIWGKTIHVVGADDERSESKIRGSTFCGAYVDEATIIPESVFKMLISRCAMGGAKIFATTNPDSPYHWLKRDFIDNNEDVKTFAFTLHDNPNLTEDEKMYLSRQYKGIWFQRFIEGLWVQAEGSIYDFFDTTYHVIDTPPGRAQEYIIGVDYGTTNPCAFVLVGINRSKFPNMWVEDLYYYDSRVRQRQMTDSEYAEALVRFIDNRPIKAVYIDPSACSFKLELLKHGITNLYDAENEVLDGIRFTGKLINNGTLKICRKCDPLIKEFQSYVWDPKCQITGLDKPLKVNDHCIAGDSLVMTDKGLVEIQGLVGKEGLIASYNEGKMIMTHFENVRKTQQSVPVYEITLDDGSSIQATEDHLFLTEEGWKRLSSLTQSDIMIAWNTNFFKRSSFTKIIKQVIGSLRSALKKGCTLLFGSFITEKFPKVTKYTT